MNKILRVMFLIELLVCFGSALSLLTGGLFLIPFMLAGGVGGLELSIMAITIFLGAFGVFGMAWLASKLVSPETIELRPKIIFMSAISGVCSLGLFYWNYKFHSQVLNAVVFILPVLAGIQLLLMGRNYLFRVR